MAGGEIYYFDFGEAEGSVQSGRRPVLVLQDDKFNVKSPTVIVASITAVLKKKYLPSHIVLGEEFGLSKPSMVLLEQIQTINKSGLTDYIDFLPANIELSGLEVSLVNVMSRETLLRGYIESIRNNKHK